MMICLLTFVLLLASAQGDRPSHPKLIHGADDLYIPGSFIFRFNASAQIAVSAVQFKAMEALTDPVTKTPEADLVATYIQVFKGFSVENMNNASNVERILDLDIIGSAEEVQRTKAMSRQQNPPSWGLDRIDQTNLPLDNVYRYEFNGGNAQFDASGVNVYIIDSGVKMDQQDFALRDYCGYTFTNSSCNDGNGHGTHVTGIIGGTNYGVAKQVDLYAVKVLGSDGDGNTAILLAGMDYVAMQARQITQAVVSVIGVGGFKSKAIDDAAAYLMDSAGAFVSVAAGNEGDDACNYSPGRVSGVMTVAASNEDDGFANYSNYGSCIDIVAPGSNITSTWIGTGSSDVKKTLSGTSMAAAFVGGVAALYVQRGKDEGQEPSPAQIKTYMLNDALSDKLSGVPSNTPNRLLSIVALNGGKGTSSPTPDPSGAFVKEHLWIAFLSTLFVFGLF